MYKCAICAASPSLLNTALTGDVGGGAAGLLPCLRMNDHAADWALRNTTQKKTFNRVYTLNKHVPDMGAESHLKTRSDTNQQ